MCNQYDDKQSTTEWTTRTFLSLDQDKLVGLTQGPGLQRTLQSSNDWWKVMNAHHYSLVIKLMFLVATPPPTPP